MMFTYCRIKTPSAFLRLSVSLDEAMILQERLLAFTKYNGRIHFGKLPHWWKPAESAFEMRYYVNAESGNPVVVIYFIPDGSRCNVYMAVVYA